MRVHNCVNDLSVYVCALKCVCLCLCVCVRARVRVMNICGICICTVCCIYCTCHVRLHIDEIAL